MLQGQTRHLVTERFFLVQVCGTVYHSRFMTPHCPNVFLAND